MPRGWTKTRAYDSHHFDADAWSVVTPRAGDVIVATAYKSGTTWMQQIVSQLVFEGAAPAALGELSPWVDLRVPPREVKRGMIEGLPSPRILKTHLPTTGLEYDENAKYIYVARDGRDAFMSLVNHYKNGNEAFYGALNGPGLKGAPLPTWEEACEGEGDEKLRALFDKWLNTPWGQHPWEEDGWPFWSLFYNMKTWWDARESKNIIFVHFSDLKKDLKGQMRRIAKFLNAPIDESKFDAQVTACTFESMKGNAASVAPLGGALWKGGAETFINKGTNGRWRNVLTKEQVKQYEQVAEKRLGKDCAKWLANGGDMNGRGCVIM